MLFNAYADMQEDLFGLRIKSGGHIFAEQGRRISRPRGREDWLLFYVAKDSERFFFSGTVQDADGGSFVLFRPHEAQEHIHQGARTAEFYYVHFLAPAHFDPMGLESSRVYRGRPTGRVRDLFEEILEELQIKPARYETLCAVKLLELLTLFARRESDREDPHREYAPRIASVIQLMNRDYAGGHSLEDYAAICRMSKYHFLRVFKAVTGSTPLDYKNRIRMEHAKELLEDESLTVGEIGAQLGFSSPSYFCDAFKKSFGVSPMSYRKKR